MKPTPQFTQANVITAFSRAARSYDAAAVLQQETGRRLLERLDIIKLKPANILDLGCGTGYFTGPLKKRYPKSHIVAADITAGMLQQAIHKKRWWQRNLAQFICIDAQQIPLPNHSMDLIFSNMMLHWIVDLPRVLQEIHRILKPDGLLFFSTLGPDTLKELKHCWANIDEKVHVHDFIDMHDIGDCLQTEKFRDPVMDMEKITLEYSDIKALMQDLKATGSQNRTAEKLDGLTGKTLFNQLVSCYEHHRNSDGRLPATFEVIYGHAWGTVIQSNVSSTEIRIPVEQIFKRK